MEIKSTNLKILGHCPFCKSSILFIESENTQIHTYTCKHGGTVVIPCSKQVDNVDNKNTSLNDMITLINQQKKLTPSECEEIKNIILNKDKEVLKD